MISKGAAGGTGVACLAAVGFALLVVAASPSASEPLVLGLVPALGGDGRDARPSARDCGQECALACGCARWGFAAAVLLSAAVLAAAVVSSRRLESFALAIVVLAVVWGAWGACYGACRECAEACREYNHTLRERWPDAR